MSKSAGALPLTYEAQKKAVVAAIRSPVVPYEPARTVCASPTSDWWSPPIPERAPMAMRLRTVEGTMIAVCAALTEPKDGDVYLDDGQHYALTMKYMHEAGYDVGEYADLMEREQGYRDAAAEHEAWTRSQDVSATP